MIKGWDNEFKKSKRYNDHRCYRCKKKWRYI
jgi:hypothetical protein